MATVMDDRRTFFGRERERELLQDALGGLAAGRGEVLLVAGEAGIGKTRLLTELATMAREAGVTVAWGRASEAGGAPALWPWQELLRELLRVHGAEALAAAAGASRPLIARLLPALGDAGAASEIESASARFQLFDAVTCLIAELAPAVIVLDDLHAADLASLLLLEHAAPQLARAGMLVVGSFRPEDAELAPEVARILWRVVRGATHVPLARLAAREVAELLEAVLGRAPAADELARVMRTTEGSPLFVTEYARLMRTQGVLLPSLPPAVRHALEARVMRLPEATRAALATVSVLGRVVEPQLFAALGVAERDLAPAIAAGLLLERDVRKGALGGWMFSHILLRDALYSWLADAEREALHARAADVLIEQRRPLAEVAHHRLLAGAQVSDVALLETVRGATAELVRVLAFDDAANLVERALGARPCCERSGCRPAASAPFGERARAELMTLLGGARIRGGRLNEGRATCGEAAAIARQLGDHELFARAALAAGIAFTPGAVDPQLVALLEEASHGLEADAHPALAARLLARLAAAHQPAEEPEIPVRLAHEAIALGRAAGEPGVMLDVLAGATSALAYFEAPSVREPLDQELRSLARRAGDRVLELRAEARLFYDLLDAGRRPDLHLEAVERLAEELAQPRFQWHALLMRASLRAALGDFAQADRLEAEGATLATAAGDERPWQQARIMYRYPRTIAEGRDDELAALEAAALRWLASETLPERECRAALLIALAARRGDLARARSLLAQLGPDSWAESKEMLTMSWLADAFIALGERPRMEALQRRLLPYGDWQITAAVPFPSYGGPFALTLGRLALALGDRAAARSWLEKAVLSTAALGARPAHELASKELAALGHAPVEMPVTKTEAKKVARPRLARDGELWALSAGGATARFKDARGFQMLAALLAEPGAEVAALVLDGAGEAEPAGVDALDPAAVKAYRARLADLKEDAAEADARGDFHRASVLGDEIEALGRELARGLGIGGRVRKLAAPAERARINVQRRIKDAIGRIAAALPEVGQHLEVSVRTGTFCVYDPK